MISFKTSKFKDLILKKLNARTLAKTTAQIRQSRNSVNQGIEDRIKQS